MPDWLNATTGLDALTHAIEAFVSRAHNPLTDSHALHAAGLIISNLLQAQQRPNEMAPRLAMAQGSLEAGRAFSNAIMRATHTTPPHHAPHLPPTPHHTTTTIP